MTTAIRVGAWRVDPDSGNISREGKTTRLELRTMRLLLCLAERAGSGVSIDDLLAHVWSGIAVTPASVYQAVASLRRTLGDDPRHPAYVETVPRHGYRMVATVGPWEEDPTVAVPELQAAKGADLSSLILLEACPVGFAAYLQRGLLPAGWAVLCLGLGIGTWLVLMHGKGRATQQTAAGVAVPLSQKALAVLPFLDLTEGMKQGEFTDGLTEELIDKLSKVPSLRVPSPTSSFYFKDKPVQSPRLPVGSEPRMYLMEAYANQAPGCEWRRGWFGPIRDMLSGLRRMTDPGATPSCFRTISREHWLTR